MQVSLQYLSPPTEEIFQHYHSCLSQTHHTVILHLNGCGPAPRFCPGYQGATAYSSSHSVVFDIVLDRQLFWTMLGEKDQELFKGKITPSVMDKHIFIYQSFYQSGRNKVHHSIVRISEEKFMINKRTTNNWSLQSNKTQIKRRFRN